MAKRNEVWKMPDWMKPLAPMFANTGREANVEAIEELFNGTTDPLINLPLSTIEFGIKSQVTLLYILYKSSKLKL